MCAIKFYDDLNSVLLSSSSSSVLLESGGLWSLAAAQQLKYLDCIHKVYVGDQLRILPSVPATMGGAVHLLLLVRSISVFTNIVMSSSEHKCTRAHSCQPLVVPPLTLTPAHHYCVQMEHLSI